MELKKLEATQEKIWGESNYSLYALNMHVGITLFKGGQPLAVGVQ